MICKDTIEEKIMAFKKSKQAVADALISVDEDMMKQLKQKDMMALLN